MPMIFYGKATKKNLNTLKEAFLIYDKLSGQVVSVEKKKIFLSGNASNALALSLSRAWNLSGGHLPINYMGVPLFRGKPKTCHLREIADKIKCRLTSWTGKSLSIAGRLTLIKSVVASSFIHSFMVYRWPEKLLKEFFSCIRPGSIFERKIVTVAWKSVCQKFLDGGLGVRDLSMSNGVFLKKLAWDIMTNNSYGMTFLRNRYLDKNLQPQLEL